MKYELNRSHKSNYFSLSSKPLTGFSFPLHFHKSFEILFVEEGEHLVQIDNVEFAVKAGDCAIILPGQFHAYRTEGYSRIFISIFSIDFLPDLDKYRRDVHPHHPVFSFGERISHATLDALKNNPFALKSMLYDLAARYVSGAPFDGFGEKQDDLLYDIVEYINGHFGEPLTLKDVAAHFGYNYRYMSGIINRSFHMSFSAVLRQYRIDHACRLLTESKASITELSDLCGFDTIRSFNRAFKEITGKTPREYRCGFEHTVHTL